MESPQPHFTESTISYWQSTLNASDPEAVAAKKAPYRYRYPAMLLNDRVIFLPIRPLSGQSHHAVASLLVNQASFEVVDELSTFLAERLQLHLSQLEEPVDVIIGLPTLGNTLAPIVAKNLGFSRYVPLGYSRKFWYEESLSTSTSSITSPGQEKAVYLDPYLLPLVQGKRVVIIDDAVSSGKTMKAMWDFLEGVEIHAEVIVCGVAMTQGGEWREILGEERAGRVVGLLESPLLEACEGGWQIRT